MDLRKVQLFVLAAETLNISAAGRALGLSPAVAGAHLANLERELGADLLHRSTRRVSLSLEGQEFLPYAQELLAQEASARAAMGVGRSEISGTLRFTAPSSFADAYIVGNLAPFLDAHPGIALDLRLSDTQQNLIEGSFDLALRNMALPDSSLKARKLTKDRRVLCASPAYLEANGVPQKPADLAHHTLIAFADIKPRRLLRNGERDGVFDPSGGQGARLIFDDGRSMKRAAMAGLGIARSSIWNIATELSEGTLVRVLPEHEVDDPAALWLVYPRANVLSPKVRVFMDFLTDTLGRHPPWERLIGL